MNKISRPRVIAVAAIDEVAGMGLQDRLPWHCSEDLRHFKVLTTGGVLVMGRKTALGLKQPLPNRYSYVLTTNVERAIPQLAQYSHEWQLVEDFEDVLKLAVTHHKTERVFVIGGAQVYDSLVAYVDEIYLTRISGTHEADTYFPMDTYGLVQTRGPFRLEAGRGIAPNAKVQHWVRR